MGVLDPIPDEYPDPDCPACGGEGVPQSRAHFLMDDDGFSNRACPKCNQDDSPPENT